MLASAGRCRASLLDSGAAGAAASAALAAGAGADSAAAASSDSAAAQGSSFASGLVGSRRGLRPRLRRADLDLLRLLRPRLRLRLR